MSEQRDYCCQPRHDCGYSRNCDPRAGFRRHLLVFLLVNTLLIAINLLTHPEHLWFQWPLLGWGIGIAAHFFGIRQARGHEKD